MTSGNLRLDAHHGRENALDDPRALLASLGYPRGVTPLETWSSDRRDIPKRSAAPASAHLIVLSAADQPHGQSSRHRLTGLTEVVLGRDESRTHHRAGPRLSLGVPDNHMSRTHARLTCANNTWSITDAGSRNGTNVNGETCSTVVLGDGDLIEVGHTTLLFRELVDDEVLPVDCGTTALATALPHVASFCPELVRALNDLPRIATAQVAILVRGETGSGKEVIARAVHAMSRRRGRFIAVNCGALPETLVESELFGVKKGAFSGAHSDRPGLVRMAEGGTLFLDEIGDLSPTSQAALLRVLQEREVMPLGGTSPVPIDINLVSATHRDLEGIGEAGFRRDLYARIAGYTVHVPALRDRREDLGLLVGALLERIADGGRPFMLDVEAMRAIAWYDWPLNIRELESCLRVAAALASDGMIMSAQLPDLVQRASAVADAAGLSGEDQRRRDHLVQLLKLHGGNISAVARASGKARVQIQRWLRRYALNPAVFKR